MDNLLPENETVEVEGRRYLNPNLVIDETNTFIDKLRGTQGMNTQEIATQTEMLGTDIPSSQGGLMGANSYFTSRYQTPQANSAVANLRRVAQESALNQALANEQAMWKKRYDEAYRRYQKRQNDKTNLTDDPSRNGGLEYEDTEEVTGLTAEQDINRYDVDSTVYDSTEQSFDSRSTERSKNISVTKDSNGNVSSVTVNGVPSYGREARARYRYLKNAGLVR